MNTELLIYFLEQDEQRIAERLENFGSIGLEKLKLEFNQARLNNKQSSSECANISTDSIPYNTQLHLPPIEYNSNTEQIDLYHSPTSQFLKYTLHIPMKDFPLDLQIYLPLFSNLLFHTSIEYNQIHLDKYHFCELITRDILGYSVSNGQSSSSPTQSSYVHTHYMDTFMISLQSISTKEIYKNTIDYIRYALFGTVFNDYKIILEECEKQLKNLIEALQDGQTIHQGYFNCLLNTNDINHCYHQMNIFVQKKFFEKISKQPNKYQNEIISKLQEIQNFILKNLSQMHLTIAGNIELIKEDWQIVEEFMNETKLKSQNIEIKNYPIKEKSISLTSPATIIGSQHEESGYVLRWSRISISQEDLIPLLIFSNYLDMENGPLWTACRTNGYSYGVAFDFDYEKNLILLSINQCSQLKLAYSSALKTLENILNNQTNIDYQRINGAKNLTICMLTEHLSTLGRVIDVSLRSYLNKYSIEKYENLLNEIYLFNFNQEIIIKLIEKYIQPLINENQSSTLILVNTNKMKETQEYLQKEYQMKNITLIKDVVKHLSR